MQKISVRMMSMCAMFAALSGVLSQIAVPIGPVPITLTHISVFISAGLLGVEYGTISQVLFVLMGAAGLPVFARFSGGMGVLLGPTGGFIIGYVLCAMVMGLLIQRFGSSRIALVCAMMAGLLCSYFAGTLWYMFIMEATLVSALMTCVVPFLIGDLVKILLSFWLIRRLSPLLPQPN